MGTSAAGKNRQNAAQRPGRKRYDKELVRDRTLELLAIRLGPPKDQGARSVWDCPACGKREKYSVVKATGKGGCLVADCRLAGSADVFAMLADLEDLDYQADFLAVLARSYELLGLEPDAGDGAAAAGASPKAPPRAVLVPRRSRSSQNGGAHDPRPHPDRTETRRGDSPSPGDLRALLALAARVYQRILELCPLESRDRGYLRGRGISYETIRRGRFGTMTALRAKNVKAVLQREFGRQELLKVPGFSEDEDDGRLKFTLTGDYILIPYHDAQGCVTTIEGRVVGESQGPRKYVTLRRAGNHLYLFPGRRPGDLLAVCEGAMGAIVAAECGFAVGAIMGCERFRASPSPEMLDGTPGDSLLELKGADFGGRTVPYIPDAEDPPNPNVLRAAPKAARWIAQPQNGRAAICLLPKGADLDEWLLSLDPDERQARFAGLLAGASPPEDASSPTPESASPTGTQPDTGLQDDTPNAPKRSGETGNGGGVFTAKDVTGRGTKTPPGRKRNAKTGTKSGASREETGTPQPGLWEESESAEGGAGGVATGNDADRTRSGRRGVSAGARKLRDEVYRAMIDALPPKEEHLRALEKRGVMRATARVGRFASLDAARAKQIAAALAGRFGAKRLLSVPGFEADGASPGKVRLSLAFRQAGEEHVLLPCFDAEGLLSGLEGLAIDPETGEIGAEETVPLKGAGGHLYVFAHYEPGQVEGFCEGPLGAMLTAQEDIVIGAVGGFRRYKAASGPGEGRQPVDAVLPELEGVDFDGRQIAYAPRAGAALGEANARYHEAAPATRWLVERQNGRPAVLGFGDGDEPAHDDNEAAAGAVEESGMPTSLGEWILSLDEDDASERLRELFPESPVREQAVRPVDDQRRTDESGDDATPPPLPSKVAYTMLALAAVAGAVLDGLILRLRDFAGYVSVGPGGDQIMYAGHLGPVRRLADSPPFHLLYDLHSLAAFAAALAVAFAVVSKARRTHLARWRTGRIRPEERWELHLTPAKQRPSGTVLTPGEALWTVLAWPVAYVLSGWLLSGAWGLLLLAARLEMAPDVGAPVADPTLASIYAATLFSVFVLWRRRSIRAGEAAMLRGKIRH